MDKLKEHLKTLGLTDEQIEAVIKDTVTPHIETEVKGLKDKNFALVGEKKTLTTKLSELEKLTEKPEDKPADKPESKPDPLMLQLAESIKAIQQEMNQSKQSMIKNTLTSKYLTDAKNANLILTQLDMEKLSEQNGKILLTIEDGSQVEVNTVFDVMRKSEETSFLFGKTATQAVKKTTNFMGIEIPLDTNDPAAVVDNPWSSKNLNYTHQNEILAKSPELAATLQAAAKVENTQQQAPTPPTGAPNQQPATMLVNPFA